MGETRDWLKFFEQAGIPRSASAQYAVAFIDNRISMEMLMDLNKEYLRDMGITKLGDIISILKQAKVVSQKRSADKALSNKIEEEPEAKVAIQVKQPVEAPIAALHPKKAVPIAPKKPPPNVENERVVIQGKFPVSNRLGPPPEQKFSNALKKNANVFCRLGFGEKMKTNSSANEYGNKPRLKANEEATESPERFAASSRETYQNDFSKEVQKGGGVARKRMALHGPSPSVASKYVNSKSNRDSPDSTTLKRNVSLKTSSHGVFNKSHEPNWEKVPVQKRLGNIRPVPATASEVDDVYNDKPRKVKYVMVQTLKDGSQVRKTLRPDDPLLKRVSISKTRVKIAAPQPSSRRSLSPVPKKSPRMISTKKPYEGFSLNRSLPENHHLGEGRPRNSNNYFQDSKKSSYASRKPNHNKRNF